MVDGLGPFGKSNKWEWKGSFKIPMIIIHIIADKINERDDTHLMLCAVLFITKKDLQVDTLHTFHHT